MLSIVRHLPTHWNREGLMQGRRDIPILPVEGKLATQLESLKGTLAGKAVKKVLVSSLRRTRETALALGFDTWTVEPLLDELDFGPYEGRPRSELHGELGEDWVRDPRKITLGESMSAFEGRLRAFIRRYASEERLLAVGHGSWIRGLTTLVRDGDLRRMNQFTVANIQLCQVDLTTVSGHAAPD